MWLRPTRGALGIRTRSETRNEGEKFEGEEVGGARKQTQELKSAEAA